MACCRSPAASWSSPKTKPHLPLLPEKNKLKLKHAESIKDVRVAWCSLSILERNLYGPVNLSLGPSWKKLATALQTVQLSRRSNILAPTSMIRCWARKEESSQNSYCCHSRSLIRWPMPPDGMAILYHLHLPWTLSSNSAVRSNQFGQNSQNPPPNNAMHKALSILKIIYVLQWLLCLCNVMATTTTTTTTSFNTILNASTIQAKAVGELHGHKSKHYRHDCDNDIRTVRATATATTRITIAKYVMNRSSDKPCLTLRIIHHLPPHPHQLFHHRPPTYASYSPNVLPNCIS